MSCAKTHLLWKTFPEQLSPKKDLKVTGDLLVLNLNYNLLIEVLSQLLYPSIRAGTELLRS